MNTIIPKVQKPSRNRAQRSTSVPKRFLASHPSPDELYERGKDLRKKCPRQSHAVWRPPDNRPDPVSLLEKSSDGRIPHLIPIRYGRMLHSPFAFYRGAALNMAGDLASTPVTGLRVQACGDCHLLNFSAFAAPERRVIFDINEFDETLPAPWEWDVKRLAASCVLACRNNGFGDGSARDVVLACVRSYRNHMTELGQMRALEVWHARTDAESLVSIIKNIQAGKRAEKRLTVAREGNVLEHHFPKLAEVAGRLPTIKDNPPHIYHLRERSQKEFFAGIEAAFASYRETLPEDRRQLLDRFEVRDIVMKVVGVGSVGIRCGIVLLMAGEQDILFLQIKEARASVLEPYGGQSVYPNHGQRVVNGCRLMQSAGDLFLGWTAGPDGRHYYVRQLRDTKIKVPVELFGRSVMMDYARLCGRTLARAHARSGKPAQISGYLGKSDKFDQAIADFSIAYADQSERDYEQFMKAVQAGRLEVEAERD